MADEWDIESLSYDELVALNRRIVDRLKHLHEIRDQYHMLALNIGNRVSFDAGLQHGGRLSATVIKFNRKTVGVVTDDGRRWNVSPELLSPVTGESPEQGSSKTQKDRNRGR